METDKILKWSVSTSKSSLCGPRVNGGAGVTDSFSVWGVPDVLGSSERKKIEKATNNCSA